MYIFVPRCLNNFWCCLTQDKECNSKKGYLAVTSPWFALISSLSVLAEAEKTYSSFSFVVKKRFRKDVSGDQINNKSNNIDYAIVEMLPPTMFLMTEEQWDFQNNEKRMEHSHHWIMTW